MVVLHRTLHPSGHGAFFTERIRQDGKDDFIVVYDCGAKDVEAGENAGYWKSVKVETSDGEGLVKAVKVHSS